jgi:hypothetical protein
MKSLNVGGGLRVIAERLAKDAHRLGQRRIGDEGILPDAVDELLTRYYLTGAAKQHLEDAQDARRKRELDAVPRQETIPRIERERAEGQAARPHQTRMLPPP